ncbi:hypothetical protein FRB93_000002 [Tulasnella sp. JGI-2019a]|nr:hypothetical protein FRB93_000002 [Tulasnella sp. JGI-2019a]
MLYQNLRIHQIFGANTNVGKTIIATVLCRAQAQRLKGEDRAAVESSPRVFYLKPVSTGPQDEADDRHTLRFGGPQKNMIASRCLYQFDKPISPHLAALGRHDAPSDGDLLDKISGYTDAIATSVPRHALASMFIESAGGVHSPVPSGSTQAEAYRPLRLPTILVGDANLGGISSTISAYESLLLRGYDIESLLIFKDDYYRNWEYLVKWFAERNNGTIGTKVHVATLNKPPQRCSDPTFDHKAMEDYYATICDSTTEPSQVESCIQHLELRHTERLQNLRSMPQRTMERVWWPFVQHGLIKEDRDVTVIDSARGDFFDVYTTPNSSTPDETSNQSTTTSLLNPSFDGSASWWTQSVGHSNSSVTLAAAYAAGRYGHVIFPTATHEPALTLAETLITDGPGRGWAERVFFSDNGSTGMEVALKMALRANSVQFGSSSEMTVPKNEVGVLGLKGSYHGDTIGTMDACEGGIYNSVVDWYRGRGYWFDVPTIGFRDGSVHISGSEKMILGSWPLEFSSLVDVYDVEHRLYSSLAAGYQRYIRETLERLILKERKVFGALVIEPLVMGAGGMLFVDPLFHRVLIDVVRSSEDLFSRAITVPKDTSSSHGNWKGLPVIFDEVFSGLYRLGTLTSSVIMKVHPDISVHAKTLTGGLLPLSVTLASRSIFEAFQSTEKVDALLHGHSYTAHPVGCSVANEALGMMGRMRSDGEWDPARAKWGLLPVAKGNESSTPEVWSFWDPTFVRELSKLPMVEEVMTLGTVMAFRLQDLSGGYQSTLAQRILKGLNASEVEATPPLNSKATFSFNIHHRTLGDVAYFMTSLNTPEITIRALESRIMSVLQQAAP